MLVTNKIQNIIISYVSISLISPSLKMSKDKEILGLRGLCWREMVFLEQNCGVTPLEGLF